MSRIDTVVFDLGDVLIPWNPRNLYRKLFQDEASMEHFLGTICTPEWNAQQDAGRSLEEGTELLVAAFPEEEARIRAFYDRWSEMLGAAIEGSVKLVLELKAQGYRVLALSNWSAETFPRARTLYPVLDEFEGIVVSGFEGMAKPDPRIYRLLCERHGVAPERTVFIDDSLRNVEGARGVGMQAIHFQSPDALRESLAAMGILTPSRAAKNE